MKIDAEQFALAALMGQRVIFNQHIRSDRVLVVNLHRGVHLVAFSSTALNLIMHRVVWHDERTGCPTWTDAAECRCDVEPPR